MKCVRLGLEKIKWLKNNWHLTSWLQSLPSKILHGATASNVTIMKHHPRAPTNWPCDIGTTTCSWFILFPFHLIFHPSFSNTEMRAIIPTDWSKKKIKNTHLSESGGGQRSEYYCTVKSWSQKLHISQEISLSMKNHVYHKTLEVKITSRSSNQGRF